MESQRLIKFIFNLIFCILHLDVKFTNGTSNTTWSSDTQFGESEIPDQNDLNIFKETSYHDNDRSKDTITEFDWSGGFIPFVIDASVLDYQNVVTDISESQDEINYQICLKFRAKEANDNIWVRYSINSDEANCVSYLTLPTSSTNQEEINLIFSPKCTRVDIFHETLHTLEILENPSNFSGIEQQYTDNEPQDNLYYPLDNPAALGDPNLAKYRLKLANSDIQLIKSKYKCNETETTNPSSTKATAEATNKPESNMDEEYDKVGSSIESNSSSQIQISTTDTITFANAVVSTKLVPSPTTTSSTSFPNSPTKPPPAPAKPSCIFPMKPPFCQ